MRGSSSDNKPSSFTAEQTIERGGTNQTEARRELFMWRQVDENFRNYKFEELTPLVSFYFHSI